MYYESLILMNAIVKLIKCTTWYSNTWVTKMEVERNVIECTCDVSLVIGTCTYIFGEGSSISKSQILVDGSEMITVSVLPVSSSYCLIVRLCRLDEGIPTIKI